jgi:hypothetical protein
VERCPHPYLRDPPGYLVMYSVYTEVEAWSETNNQAPSIFLN